MTPDSPSGVLRHEHRLILSVVQVLEAALDEVAIGRAVDADVFADCVAFLRLFADACHHGKEEDLLFPELEAAGLPHDTGPIAVMLEEHRRGRALVRGMAEAMAGVRTGNPRAMADYEKNARFFIDLIRAHIGKEDHVLFNMADQLVAGAACRALCAAYGEADGCRFEQRTKADLEALAERLIAGN